PGRRADAGRLPRRGGGLPCRDRWTPATWKRPRASWQPPPGARGEASLVEAAGSRAVATVRSGPVRDAMTGPQRTSGDWEHLGPHSRRGWDAVATAPRVR